MSDAYERVIWHGHTFDRMTVAALEEMEKRLGYTLAIMQGSYNGGSGSVSASAGTHDGGGAVDLSPADYTNKVRVGREIGFAMWHRLYLPGVWGEHVHGILDGDEHASQGAKNQIAYYKQGLDGLADHRPDNGPRITLHPYVYDPVSAWSSGQVYVSHLQYGAVHSDSVKRLQYQLQRWPKDGGTDHLVADGSYGDQTRWAVRKWQNNVAKLDPKDGRRVPNWQAHHLFNKAYDVTETP